MKIIEAASFPVDEIVVEARLRDVDADHVAVIASTIEASTLLHPITLRKVNNRHVLVTGAHRLAAYKLLGRPYIPAQVVDVEGDGNDFAEEVEIIENVARNDLSPLDRAIHLGKLSEIDERRNGPRKAGRPSKSLKEGEKEIAQSLRYFDRVTAEMKFSRRTVEQYLALYRKLAPEVRETLKGMDIADNFSELQKLAAEKPEDQIGFLGEMRGENPARTVAEAASRFLNKVDTTSPDEKHMAAFIKLWAKASKKARKQMLAYAEKNMGV